MAACSAFLPFKKVRRDGAAAKDDVHRSVLCSIPSSASQSELAAFEEEIDELCHNGHHSDVQSSKSDDKSLTSVSTPAPSQPFDSFMKDEGSRKSLWLVPVRAGYGDWMEEALAHVQQKSESKSSVQYLSDTPPGPRCQLEIPEVSEGMEESSLAFHREVGRFNASLPAANSLLVSLDPKGEMAAHTENSNAQVPMRAGENFPGKGDLICASRFPKFCIHPIFIQFLPSDAENAVKRLDKAVLSSEMKANAKNRMKDLLLLLLRLADDNVLTLVKSKNEAENSILGFAEIHVHELPTFNTEIRLMVQQDKKHCWLVNGKVDIKEPTGPVYEILRQIGIRPMRGMRGPRFSDPGKRDFMYSYR
eukprot:766457-Hanusia_phi.AAC.9